MISIFTKMDKYLNLNHHNKSPRKEIRLAILKYLLGLSKYGYTHLIMREYGESREFKKFLNSLSEKELTYIIRGFRGYMKYGNVYRKKYKVRITKLDKKWLKLLKSEFNTNKIKVINNIPSIEMVLKNIKPVLLHRSKTLYLFNKADTMLGLEDFISELNMKVMEMYQIYIFSFNIANFNEKVFYSCLINGLKTKGIDIGMKNKREKSENTNVPFHEYEIGNISCDLMRKESEWNNDIVPIYMYSY